MWSKRISGDLSKEKYIKCSCLGGTAARCCFATLSFLCWTGYLCWAHKGHCYFHVQQQVLSGWLGCRQQSESRWWTYTSLSVCSGASPSLAEQSGVLSYLQLLSGFAWGLMVGEDFHRHYQNHYHYPSCPQLRTGCEVVSLWEVDSEYGNQWSLSSHNQSFKIVVLVCYWFLLQFQASSIVTRVSCWNVVIPNTHWKACSTIHFLSIAY